MDTETTKIRKSFISLVDELEVDVNKFAKLFSDLKDNTFVQSIVSILSNVEKKSEEIKEFIEDRIKNHIQKEVLGKTWIDSIKNEYGIDLDRPMPKLLELEEDRKKQLADMAGNNNPMTNWQG
jgi:glycyl-tRNA synthetase beta subunit